MIMSVELERMRKEAVMGYLRH